MAQSMDDPSARTFSSDFKRFFLRGLVVLLPTVLTLWIVVKAYQFVNGNIAEPINAGVRLAIGKATPHWGPLHDRFEPTDDAVYGEMARLSASSVKVEPTAAVARANLRAAAIDEWWRQHWAMDFIGLVIAIVSVYIAGRFVGGFFGRRIYRQIESFVTALPVFKQVYPYVKQVVDFLFSEEQPIKFNRVVVVQYPRQGIWSLGFLTGGTMRAIAAQSGDALTVFIPSSPTPFTGYTITVPRREVIEVPITVDEALRFTVTGGVLVPPRQSVSSDDEATTEALGRQVHEQIGLVPIPNEPADDEGDAADGADDAAEPDVPRRRDAV